MKIVKYTALVLATVILMKLPIIGAFLRVIDTMIHESGHALAVLMMSGKVYYIELFANAEGVTLTGSRSYLGGFITSIAGYVFSSLAVVFFAYLWRWKKDKVILGVLFLFSVVNLLLWVRNVYGIVWLILFSLLLFFTMRMKDGKKLSSITFSLYVLLLLSSVVSAFDILTLSILAPDGAGDAANLARMTGIPAIVWGLFFFAQAAFLGVLSVMAVIGKRSPKTRARHITGSFQ